jgi:hypothetical protein
MAALSEEAYSAGWMQDIEFELWQAVLEGPRRCGHFDLTNDHVAKLSTLAEQCGGSVRFSDEAMDEVFVPMPEWEQLYAARIGQR